MTETTIIDIDEAPVVKRGGGIVTRPLIVRQNTPDAKFTTGMSTFPPGQGAPMHSHNCDEQVTVLEGRGEVEVDGVATALKRHDTTYIPATLPHKFYNTGDRPFTILWIYGAGEVTRTFTDTGETVEHLSAADLMVSD